MRKFRTGNLDLSDEHHSGALKKVENEELDQLLQGNPCQAEEKLAEQPRVTRQKISHFDKYQFSAKKELICRLIR